MKQFWFGLGLIGVILVSGLFLEQKLEQRHIPQAKDLERASVCAGKEDWPQAEALVKRARKDWKSSRNLAASAVHHQLIGDIDIRFAELAVYAAEGSTAEFSAGCEALAQLLRSLPEAHGYAWWNLL